MQRIFQAKGFYMKTKLKFMFMASVFLGIVIFAAIAADNSDSLNNHTDRES